MLTKKRIILLIIMAAVLIVAPVLAIFSSRTPAGDGQQMRVLTLWQIDSFEGGKGSRAKYLQDIADQYFEDAHLYVRVTALSADAARANLSDGNIPDMISYGAGFYGLESYLNDNCDCINWCRGAYVLITLGGEPDFSSVTPQNTVINAGKDNLASACALFEGLNGADVAAPTSAYVSLIGGKYKYLLGTQRDIYRLTTRGESFSVKVITSFNDLYQNISILCGGEDYNYCRQFIFYLLQTSEGVESLGLISDKTNHTGAMRQLQAATFEYTLNSFIGRDYYDKLTSTVERGDINSLKNLLK